MLSRPNMVMNQGSPAAGSGPPSEIGANRSAARSIRLRRYVPASGSWSLLSCGARPTSSSRSSRMAAGPRAAPNAVIARTSRPAAPWMIGVEVTQVLHWACGATVIDQVIPLGSTSGVGAAGDDPLPVEVPPAVASAAAVLAGLGVVSPFLSRRP